jgi:hypothetical protein
MNKRHLFFSKKLGLAIVVFSLMIVLLIQPALAAQVTLLNDGFENTVTPFANWDDNGTTTWNISTLNYHSGTYSAFATSAGTNNLTSDNLDASNAMSISVDFWYRHSTTAAGRFLLYYYNGSTYNQIADLGIIGSNNVWLHYTQTLTDSQYFISNFRIRFQGILNGGQLIYVDDVLITKDTGETLTVSKSGNGTGTATSNPAGIDCGATCSEKFATNSSVTLSAVADTGSTFTGWSGAGCSGTGTCVVTMDATKTVTADFNLTEYTLDVTSAHGTVTKDPDQATYHYGDVVELTATPDAGWSFGSWSGDVTDTANPVSVTIYGNTAVTANYTQDEYTLDVTSAHGTVAKDPDQATYHYGDVVELTATPDAGWSFGSWSGDVTDTANPVSVTIYGNTAVTANYTQDEYTLDVTSAHGTVAKDPDQATYHYGDVVELTATPDAGWSFGSWSGDVTDTANPVSATIYGNTAVTANYTQEGFILTVTSAHGTVAKDPDQATYHYGDVVELTATPDAGWSFASWSGDVTDTANPVSVTIYGNTAVTANYTLNQFILSVVRIGNGTVTSVPTGIDCGGTCSASFGYNTLVTLSAVAAPGWYFAGWSGEGCSGTDNCVVTMDMARTVTATFKRYIFFPVYFYMR